MATMATHGMVPSLSVNGPDEDMEITSDAGRPEQDFDLDLMNDQYDGQEIDYMIEDGASNQGDTTAKGTHGDDLMYDDVDEITYEEEEEVMQDEHPAEQRDPADASFGTTAATHEDEILYNLAETGETFANDAPDQPEEETLIDYDAISEDEEQEPQEQEREDPYLEDGQQEQLPEQDVDARIDDESKSTSATAPAEIAEISQSLEGAPAVDQSSAAPDESTSQTTGEAAARHSPTLTGNVPFSGEASTVPQASEEASSASKFQDQAADAASGFFSLHPVTVVYNDTSLSLFQDSSSMDPSTYLLEDRSVAHSTLTDFFRACRIALGQDVDDDTELEVWAENLNLGISEDSVHCTTTSLGQIVQVYVTLANNDGLDQPDPMTLYLSTKSKFSAQLTNLFQAASEAKGLSHLDISQDNSFDEHETEQQDAEEQQTEQETVQELDSVDDAVIARDKLEANQGRDDEDVHEPQTSSVEKQDDLDVATEGSAHDGHETSGFVEDPTEYSDAHADNHGPANGYVDWQEDKQAFEQREGEIGNEFVGAEDVAERGGEGSSRSSTIQGDTFGTTQRVYTPISCDEEELIDYSEEDIDAAESLQVIPEMQEGGLDSQENQPVATEETNHPLEAVDGADVQVEAEGLHEHDDTEAGQEASGLDTTWAEADQAEITWDLEPEADNGDMSAQRLSGTFEVPDLADEDAIAFNPSVTFEVPHDSSPEEDAPARKSSGTFEVPNDSCPEEEDTAPPTASGTFQLPEDVSPEEDEIGYGDDEIDYPPAEDETQDTADQSHSASSPPGKRNREDDDEEGQLDGRDQESKRLKAG